MKIATWNVNSILVRLPQILAWMTENKPDVLCLQETKCVDEKFPHDDFAAIGYQAAIFGQPSYNGVAILSSTPAEKIVRGFTGDAESGQKRFIAADYNKVHVINTYFPNGQALDSEKFVYKLNWISELRKYLDENCDPNQFVVLCGDYNIAPDDRDVYDPKAWGGQIHCSTPEREALEQLKAFGLIDTFRLHQSESGFYSWWDYRNGAFRRNMGLRIDHIWASTALAAKCEAAWIDKVPRTNERPSDHTPVVAEFMI